MDSLRTLNLNLSYRTGRNDLISEFFIPCLERSIHYKRAAGYFTSSSLALAARGVASLASKKGKMKLVVSPYLDNDDILALQSAIKNPHKILRNIVAKGLEEIENAIIQDRLNALAWLAASDLLQIKLALRVDQNNQITRGIFHEKNGIFTDKNGNHVAFSGSANETAGGLVENFESIKVFTSWGGEKNRVSEEIENFNALWNDATFGLKVIEFSAAGKELLEQFREPNNPPDGLSLDFVYVKENPAPSKFHIPTGLVLRPYQTEAIRAWISAGGQGVLAMATGSGKTVTALILAAKVAEKNFPFVVLIVCPFINLCRQWIRELDSFGVQAIPCFQSKNKWEKNLEEGYQRLYVGLSEVCAIVTTSATFFSENFQARIQSRLYYRSFHHILIADEVHNLGAQQSKNKLPENIQLRLGLSATPERYMDPAGTEAVLSYFGGTVYEYPISRAISDGHLCRYRYVPIRVKLTNKEVEKYEKITSQLARIFSRGDLNNDINHAAMRLLIERSRLLSSATGKLHELDKLIANLPQKPKKAIFYCGDGRTTDTIHEDEIRQIQSVSRILGEKHNLRIRNFTFRESIQEREEILRDLETGFLDGVVAIRCLDEGIDLPDLRMGFILASSTNPRQFIQRRGRLLRNAPGKEYAIIYDFIIEPPDLGGKISDSAFNLERAFFQRELKRIVEFCRIADNGPEAMNLLKDLRLKYNLLSM